jgi:hypothetical protein
VESERKVIGGKREGRARKDALGPRLQLRKEPHLRTERYVEWRLCVQPSCRHCILIFSGFCVRVCIWGRRSVIRLGHVRRCLKELVRALRQLRQDIWREREDGDDSPKSYEGAYPVRVVMFIF